MNIEDIKKALEKPMDIKIDCNPFDSKGFLGIIANLEGGDIVRLCEKEIISECKFNKGDMAFYVMALEAVHESLITVLDDMDNKILESLRKHSKVITTHVNKLNKDDLESGGDQDEE